MVELSIAKPLSPGDLLMRQFAERLQSIADFPNITNARLHAKQQAFYQSLAKGRIMQAGNQVGKSFTGYHEDACWMTNRHAYNPRANAGPQHGRIIVPDFGHGEKEIALPNLSKLIPPSYFTKGSWEDSYSKQDHKLTLNNGSTVEIMSQEQELDAYAGTQRDFLHADEECDKERWDESQIRLVRRDGSWWITQTPVSGVEWVFDDYIKPLLDSGEQDNGTYYNPDAPNSHGTSVGDVLLITASIWDNAVSNGGVLPDKAIESVLSQMSPEDRAVREFGQMPNMGGAAFPEFKRSTHVVEPNDIRLHNGVWGFDGIFKLPKRARIYTTMDDGRTNPTAWLWVAAFDDGHMLTFDEHYMKGWNVQMHVDEIKRREDQLGRRIYMRVGDPAIKNTGTIGTSVQIEYAKRGIPIVTNLIPANRRIHREKVHEYFRLDPDTNRAWWEVLYSCPNTIREIGGLKNEQWQTRAVDRKQNRKEGIRDKDNHTYDAWKYLASIMPDITPQRLESLKLEFNEEFQNAFEERFGSVRVPMPVDRDSMLSRDGDIVDDDWMDADYS